MMLKSQNRGGHKHCNLLPIIHRFKCGSDGNFGLTKTYITTNQTIHRARTFHIGFYGFGGAALIWRVFVNKTCFEFVLQIGIRAKSKTFFKTTLGV